MNILIVLWTYYPHVGGISSHINTLEKKLKSEKNNVYLCTFSNIPFPLRMVFTAAHLFLDSCKKGMGLFLIRILAFKLLTNVTTFFYCISKKIDIIHAHDCVSLNSTWLARKMLKTPSVLTVHGYFTFEPIAHGDLDKKGLTLIKLFTNEEKLAYENASQIITVDSKIRKHILNFNVNKEKINKINNFVNQKEFVVDLDKKACRKMFKIPNDKIVILIARRLVEKCGVLLPLFALNHLQEEVKNKILLVYCGTGPLDKKIREFIKKNGIKNVMLLGEVPHKKMKYIYKSSEIVLIPSIPVSGVEEATSISAIEAMATGVPVIASNIGGLKEIITDGVNGILINPEPESIAKAITDLITGKKSCERLQSQLFVKESMIKSMKQIRQTYCKALKKVEFET